MNSIAKPALAPSEAELLRIRATQRVQVFADSIFAPGRDARAWELRDGRINVEVSSNPEPDDEFLTLDVHLHVKARPSR